MGSRHACCLLVKSWYIYKTSYYESCICWRFWSQYKSRVSMASLLVVKFSLKQFICAISISARKSNLNPSQMFWKVSLLQKSLMNQQQQEKKRITLLEQQVFDHSVPLVLIVEIQLVSKILSNHYFMNLIKLFLFLYNRAPHYIWKFCWKCIKGQVKKVNW